MAIIKVLAKKPAEIAHPPTHMEIAIMLNVSRETVTSISVFAEPADSKT